MAKKPEETKYTPIVKSLVLRSAELHYNGGTEIKMTKEEFIAAFMENELSGSAPMVGNRIVWTFNGLLVKTENTVDSDKPAKIGSKHH